MTKRGANASGFVRGRTGRITRCLTPALALLLAYALVFQVVLASGIMAARAAGAIEVVELCLGAGGADDAPHGSEGPQDGIVHCPLCLSRVDAALLPPPPPSPLIERLAVQVRFERDGARLFHLPSERPAYRPRDPPVISA